MNMIRKERG